MLWHQTQVSEGATFLCSDPKLFTMIDSKHLQYSSHNFIICASLDKLGILTAEHTPQFYAAILVRRAVPIQAVSVALPR